AARVVNQREAEPRLALEVGVTRGRRGLDGALAVQGRARVVAAREVVRAEVAERAREARGVAALRRQGLGGLQVREDALVLALGEQGIAQAEAQVDGRLHGGGVPREVVERADRLLEMSRRLRDRAVAEGPGSRLTQISGRLGPHLAAEAVVGEALDVLA